MENIQDHYMHPASRQFSHIANTNKSIAKHQSAAKTAFPVQLASDNTNSFVVLQRFDGDQLMLSPFSCNLSLR